jgi:hypothetical protein
MLCLAFECRSNAPDCFLQNYNCAVKNPIEAEGQSLEARPRDQNPRRNAIRGHVQTHTKEMRPCDGELKREMCCVYGKAIRSTHAKGIYIEEGKIVRRWSSQA